MIQLSLKDLCSPSYSGLARPFNRVRSGDDSNDSPFNDGPEQALVLRVIDGDTVELEDGRVVRYFGIDIPETVHPNKPVECYGPESADRNRN